MNRIEQLNIEGKRSGSGFVAHREALINSLSRAQAERVATLDDDIIIGRKGFLNYLKALAGSNIVKVTPANGSASGLGTADKGLRVVCGSHKGFIPDRAWTSDKAALTFCQVRVSPNNTVMPNTSGIELAEALSRVTPFASKEDTRPVLGCVKFIQKDGKLTLVASDGFRLAEAALTFEDGEGEALIPASELRGLIPALKRAKRVKIGFDEKPDNDGGLLSKSLIIDTELIRYKWQSEDGEYPQYDKVIPTEFSSTASFDTKEALRVSQSISAIWYDDSLKADYRPITLTIGDGKVTLQAKEDRANAQIEAETEGEARISVSGRYLAQALKACGGMAEMRASSKTSPMMFSVDGYRLLVMPMITEDTKPTAEAEEEAQAVAEGETEEEGKAEAEEAKPKRHRKAKEPVAV